MCIVIDTNTLSKVFRSDDKKHPEFEPVLKWIIENNGKMIVGGTDFNRELFGKIDWFRKLFIQLKDLNKVVVISDATRIKVLSSLRRLTTGFVRVQTMRTRLLISQCLLMVI